MINLNLGCGGVLKAGFINVDKFYTKEELQGKKGFFENVIYPDGAEYVQADICKLPFEDNFADYAESLDVVEHMGIYEIFTYMKEIRRVLKPGATLFLLTPDFTGLAMDWIRLMINEKEFNFESYIQIAEQIYGNQRAGGEFHKSAMSPNFIRFVLEKTGWSSCSIEGFVKNTPCKQIYDNELSSGFARCDMLKIKAVK